MISPTRTRTREGPTLQEFLELPGIDESPSTEYIDGRAVQKVSPQKKHNSLTGFFLRALNDWAIPAGLGEAYPEQRCTYADRSIVPDVVFLLEEHIEVDEDGSPSVATPWPPDIHIEVISPKQGMDDAVEKLRHSTDHGCAIGWLVHPYRRSIREYRPGRPPIDLPPNGVLEGEPALPGFRLGVAEVFAWLTRRKGRRPGGDPS